MNGSRSTAAAPAPLVTTEVRWFGEGAVPTALRRFVAEGTLGACEARIDVYRLGGGPDIGLKLRGRELLELKRRRSWVWGRPAADGPAGLVEVWSKWSPADGLVQTSPGDRWIDVHKQIFKRRFSGDGAEVELVEGHVPTRWVGCDVEVVVLEVEGLGAWSFALAAHGARRSHRASIASAWHALSDGPARAEILASSSGYPEFLERHFGDVATGSGFRS